MTAKNRHRNSEKNAASGQDDAPKKSQASGSAPAAPGPQRSRPRSRGFLGVLGPVVFYAALVGAAGFAAFHLQKGMEESARRAADTAAKLDGVVLQIGDLKSAVDRLESSVGVTRAELEGTVSRVSKNELETRRVEETLQKLQNDLLRDLSEGIDEVKEARGKDFSSLEKTVEERLAEASQSIKASLGEFTAAQGEAQRQLAELRARLGLVEDPALLKQELAAVVDAVAEIRAAKQTSDASADSLGGQIGAVREELQTRNREVASLSQEVEAVRSVVQETVGSLRKALSAAEAEVGAVRDRGGVLEAGVEQASNAVRHLEAQVSEAEARARRQADDLEARVKASEEGADSLSRSVSDVAGRVESLLAKHGEAESALAVYTEGAAAAQMGTRRDMEALQGDLGELRSSVDALGDLQAALAAKDASLEGLVKDLEARLAAVEGVGGEEPEQLRSLRSSLASLEAKSAKLERHEDAIASLQRALEETARTLAEMPNAGEKGE